MKSFERQIYRGLLIGSGIMALLAMAMVVTERWAIAGCCAAAWMGLIAILVHVQTRMINAGVRAMRDSLARGQGKDGRTDVSELRNRMDIVATELAELRALSLGEPEGAQVQRNLTHLAQNLRRELRLLQHSVSAAGVARTRQNAEPFSRDPE